MKKINIGVLGCADVAERYLIPTIINLFERYSIIGLASRDAEKANKFAAKFGVKAFHGYQSLINEPELDAVYIPLPNALHAEWIEKSLLRGLHVLVEKSLACNYHDACTLNNIAKENKLVLVENFQFQFHSQIEFIRKKIADGSIGELRCLRSSFGFPPFENKDNIRYKNDLGGGALLDAGAYPIKISQLFLGDNLKVKAATLNYDSDLKVDVWGGAYLKQIEGPLFSEIAFGFDNYYQCNLELWGTKGKIFTNRIFTAPPEYEPIIELETSHGKELISLPVDNHFTNMLIHFYELINLKKDMESEYLHNINQARLIAEIKKRANE